MDSRASGIVRTLAVCLSIGFAAAVIKIIYGKTTHTLTFVADGIHMMFDSAATLTGLISVIFSSKPPDEGHPYGHYKIETVAATILALLLLFAAYEVGMIAYHRLLNPHVFPQFSFWGLVIILASMAINVALARFESKRAKQLSSHFLATDSMHNLSDFFIGLAVLISLISLHWQIPYVDSGASIAITFYLVYLSLRLLAGSLKPLVDSSVLDPKQVEEVAASVEGVLYSHHIRSRGEKDHHFLDLNLHLPGHITLEKAHKIAHEVEARLKAQFPGLVDVVIHTEPHGHPPCEESEKPG
jgi:cation diffusion facilitator family transporter